MSTLVAPDCREACAKQDSISESQSDHRHCECGAVLRIEWDGEGPYSLDGEDGGGKWFCHRCLIPSETPAQLIARVKKLVQQIPCAAIEFREFGAECSINTCDRARAEYALEELARKIAV